MAATVAITDRKANVGPFKGRICTVTMDSSYDAGGEAITANQVGLLNIIGAAIIGSSAGYLASWDYTNSKLKAYYADYDAVADGALIEPTGVNLSAVSFKVWFFGTV